MRKAPMTQNHPDILLCGLKPGLIFFTLLPLAAYMVFAVIPFGTPLKITGHKVHMLVASFHSEFSVLCFDLFFINKYISSIPGTLTTTLFHGTWHGLFLPPTIRFSLPPLAITFFSSGCTEHCHDYTMTNSCNRAGRY